MGEMTATSGAVFTATDSLLLTQPLSTPDVADRVVTDREQRGSAWPAEDPSVATVSLFSDGGALYWYVETTHPDPWRDPTAALRERSPLYNTPLADAFEGPLQVVGGGAPVIHARNPDRPADPDDPDVVLVDLGIRPGPGTWLARALGWLFDRLEGTRIQHWMAESTGEVLEDERMWTESIFLAGSDDRLRLRWYMEAEDMDQVLEAYERTDNRVARWSEVVLNRLLDQPMNVLGDPMTASDYDCLVHATNPSLR